MIPGYHAVYDELDSDAGREHRNVGGVLDWMK